MPNLVTKVVVPEKVQKDLVGQSEIGQKLFDTFVGIVSSQGGLIYGRP